MKSYSFVHVFCAIFQDEAQKKLEEIKTLRSKMKDVADDARGKEDLHRQLVSHDRWRPLLDM